MCQFDEITLIQYQGWVISSLFCIEIMKIWKLKYVNLKTPNNNTWILKNGQTFGLPNTDRIFVASLLILSYTLLLGFLQVSSVLPIWFGMDVYIIATSTAKLFQTDNFQHSRCQLVGSTQKHLKMWSVPVSTVKYSQLIYTKWYVLQRVFNLAYFTLYY
jgi:hypothetical protein